jgi:hypothetical protein
MKRSEAKRAKREAEAKRRKGGWTKGAEGLFRVYACFTLKTSYFCLVISVLLSCYFFIGRRTYFWDFLWLFFYLLFTVCLFMLHVFRLLRLLRFYYYLSAAGFRRGANAFLYHITLISCFFFSLVFLF